MRSALGTTALASLGFATFATRVARADTPTLDWEKPISCPFDDKGQSLRVQCEWTAAGRRCLVAPNALPSGEPLEGVQPCAERGIEYRELAGPGVTVVRALPEVQPGYVRAATGRPYQVQFDLLNRFYFGLAWAPTFLREHEGIDAVKPFSRAQAEMGMHVSLLSPSGRSRHDLRILEGSVMLADFEVQGTLFTYDYQHLHRRPSFWITSFIGEPRVYPISDPLGWGFRLLTLRDRPASNRAVVDTELGELHAAWNPWQSPDLYSHLRVEGGVALGKFWPRRADVTKNLGGGAWYAGPTAAVRFRTSLGNGGLHYLFADVEYARPRHLDGPRAGSWFNRFGTTLAYEGVLLAINDQPISLRVGASGVARDDLIDGNSTLELKLTTGLRFSLWAPPRTFEPMPQLEDP
ncbi:MAG: hypothetical protein ABI175_22400 [Polyangiales bacterium]